MIFTESTIKISNNVSKMDSTIVLYRGDKNVEIRFTILQSPFKYSNTVATNVIESTNASFGQLVIKTPNDKPPIFSDVSATKEGTVLFTITKEMIDEIEELGVYTFQIRLMDENKQSRVTIPPVENGIEIKEPIAIEDDNSTNVVGLAKANYAVATLSDVDTPTFDDNGKYNKTNWNDGDLITNVSLNKIEDGIYTTNENVNTKSVFTNTQLDNKFGALNFTGSLNTGLNKSMTLSEAFPDILDGKYDAIKQCKLTVKVDGATIVNLTENYNMVQWQMYDNDNNLLSTAYSKPKVVRSVYFAPNDYVQFICWLDATYTPGASGSGISYDTPGYITVMLTISRSKNTEEYINKIKNLRITTTLRSLNVLVKDNKVVYTPKEDYNPATKKYVDDSKIGYIKSETVGETIDTSTMINSFNNNSYIYESNNVTYLEMGKEYHVIVNGVRYRALCINNMPGNDQIYETIIVTGDGFSISIMNKMGYNTKYYTDNTKCAYEIKLSDELLAAPPTIQILKMDIEYIPTYLMPKDLEILNSISVNRIGDIGTGSAAIGYKNTASNDFTFAMGIQTTASAPGAHAEGGLTVANASYSHAEGFKSASTGEYSHVEGIVCESSGQGSHAEGYYTVASGQRSHSEGCFTEAASQYQHVQGKYNVVDSNGVYAHIVGNGTNKNARSNAHTLDWQGNGWYSGKLSQEGAPTENKDLATKKYVDDNIGGAIRGQVNSITENINDLASFKNKVIFNFEKNQSVGYLKSDGKIFTDEKNMVCIYTNDIDCTPGDIFLYKGYGSALAMSYVFKKDKQVISSGQYDSKKDYTEITTPSGVNKVVFSSFVYSTNYSEIVFDIKLKNGTLEEKVNRAEIKNNNMQAELNILSKDCKKPVIQNYTTTNHWLNNDGNTVADPDSTDTACTDYIACDKDKEDKFYVTGHTQYETRLVATYDKNKQFLRVYGYDPKKASVNHVDFEFLPKEDEKFVRFSSYQKALIVKKVVTISLTEYVNEKTQVAYNSNILYEKKYVACGDSYTEGDFTGYTDENGLSGKNSPVIYDINRGMYKTYPWWIAERNNMVLVNEAKCGSDFTNVEGASNPFSVTRYQNVPKDADYITLMFGLNETSLTDAQIGTKTDTTNATLWGAYNIVFEYFLTNMPLAKIGVIIADAWMPRKYANAVKEICIYWGIPVLDLKFDTNVPMGIDGRPEINPKAIELRNNAFKVTSSNGHPNVEAHKYRSTIIENFLRSL